MEDRMDTLRMTLQKRTDALTSGNTEQMADLLKEGFTFVDAQGRQFDAETYIDLFVDKDAIEWISSMDDPVEVMLLGSTALVQAVTEDQFLYGTTAYLGRFRHVYLFEQTEVGWKWVFGQATSLET